MNSKGFTLIELLIVIAIIGILAGTVFVSLSDETTSASDAVIKLGLSSIRSAALAESFKSPTTNALCKNVHGKIRGGGDIIDANWTASTTCSTASNADTGKICCHSVGKKWVVWAKFNDNTISCEDSTGDSTTAIPTAITTAGC